MRRGSIRVRFQRSRRPHGRQRIRPGFNKVLHGCRTVLANLALFLVLVSAQGAGFLAHSLQVSAVDADGCFFGSDCGGGRPGEGGASQFAVLEDSAAPEARPPHDCSTCVICQQFLSSQKIHWATAPPLFAVPSMGREYVIIFLDTYPSRDIAPGNVRAPPLSGLS